MMKPRRQRHQLLCTRNQPFLVIPARGKPLTLDLTMWATLTDQWCAGYGVIDRNFTLGIQHYRPERAVDAEEIKAEHLNNLLVNIIPYLISDYRCC